MRTAVQSFIDSHLLAGNHDETGSESRQDNQEDERKTCEK
jgi:hypothetical protein